MGGEPDMLACGHHHVGDHTALQAAHPVGQHCARRPTQHLEAPGQHRQRRLGRQQARTRWHHQGARLARDPTITLVR